MDAAFPCVLDYRVFSNMHASAAALTSLDAVYLTALRFISDNYNAHHCELHARLGRLVSLCPWGLEKPGFIYLKGPHCLFFNPPYITSLLFFNAGLLHRCRLLFTELEKYSFSCFVPAAWKSMQRESKAYLIFILRAVSIFNLILCHLQLFLFQLILLFKKFILFFKFFQIIWLTWFVSFFFYFYCHF